MISFTKIRNGASSELIAHKKNRVVSIILLAFGGLFYGFGFTASGRYIYPSGISLFIYAVSLVCLFNACVNVFKDMYDIPSADVQMSMPLNGRERYFSRLLVIFCIWVLPFIISAACAFILSAMFATSHSYGHDYNYVTNAAVKTAEIAAYNLKLLLCYMETVLFIIASTIICQCCVGSKAESRYMPIIVMAVLTFLPMTLYYLINDTFADVDQGTFRLLTQTLLFSLLGDDETTEELIFSAVKSLIYIAVIGCGVFIYKKRDARSVGRPIVFTAFFEAVMGLSLLLFFAVAHMDGSFSLTAMFFAWLGSIILRVISSRKEFSFTKILRWSGLYLIYYAAFLLFMFIAFKTGGFGALYNIPDLNNGKVYHVAVTVYTPDDSWRGYRGEECSRNEKAYNMEDVRDFLELTADKAKMQSRLNKVFLREMFGRGWYDRELINESRYVVVELSSNDSYYSVYRIEFYMPADEVYTFIKEFDEFNFNKFSW